MKTTLFICSFLIFGISLFAQNSFERVFHTIESSSGRGIVETSDGGFALAVQNTLNIIGIIRIDNNGDSLWTKWYPELTSQHGLLRVNAIAETADNNLYLVGSVLGGPAFIIKTNESGDFQWITIRPQITPQPHGYMNIIAQSNDSLIAMGVYDVYASEYCCNPLLDLVDSNGGITSIGGGATGWSGATLTTYSKDSDGNLILSGGYINSVGIGRLTKRALPGDFLWNQFYNNLQVSFTSIAVGPQDEIQTVGTIHSNNFDSTLVYIFDSNGNFITQKAYSCTEQYWEGHSIVRANDGYFVGGSTGSPSSDFVLMRLNLNHELISCQTFGGASSEFLRGMISTSDGGVAMIGSSSSFGGNGYYPYLVKTNASGSVSANEIDIEPNIIQIFPNPCTTSLIVTSTEPLDNVHLRMFSLNGKSVLNMERMSGNQIELDVHEIPSGLYILNLYNDNAILQSVKVVVVD